MIILIEKCIRLCSFNRALHRLSRFCKANITLEKCITLLLLLPNTPTVTEQCQNVVNQLERT